LRVKHIEWNNQNVEHILLHDILPEEVEEVFDRKPQIRKGRQKTYIAYGVTDFGRYLMVVFKYLSQERARVIIARDMTTKERRFFKSSGK